MTTILDYSADRAYKYFLKNDSYSTIDLPDYIDFQNLLDKIDVFFQKNKDENLGNAKNYPNVNYKIISNKNGLYDWRPLQLINPVLYIDLVRVITKKENWKYICERFKKFQQNSKIKCSSIPVVNTKKSSTQLSEQVATWVKDVEKLSIKQSLDFSYIYETDIINCYASIYTHSISWALHDKDFIQQKKNRNDKKYVGNLIDKQIQNMSFSQTNGIPQGSLLMDFIVEIVLGYVDLLISEILDKQKIEDYYIVRYRDDYKVFVNDLHIGEIIIKILTETLIDFGLKLNTEKTFYSDNIILNSLKKDKCDYLSSTLNKKLCGEIKNENFLLQLYVFANNHKNSGQLKRVLVEFYKKFSVSSNDDIGVLISILVDLAYKNPKLYTICISIISKILDGISDEEKIYYIEKIRSKFSNRPNSIFVNIWLQRISYKFSDRVKYSDNLCKLVNNEVSCIWNMDWIKNSKLKDILNTVSIVDSIKLSRKINKPISNKEVDKFKSYIYDPS